MSGLQAGDRITVGVTHEVVIDGDKSWIKTEVNSAVQENETTDAAFARVSGIVEQKVMSVIEGQVAVVTNYNSRSAK